MSRSHETVCKIHGRSVSNWSVSRTCTIEVTILGVEVCCANLHGYAWIYGGLKHEAVKLGLR